MKRNKRGFTLVEVLVVVAVISVIATIAMAVYQQYLKEARIAKVISHYDDGIRSVRAELTKRMAQLSSGREGLVAMDEDYLINGLMNPGGRAVAPLGGPAYVSGAANPTTGAIGVSVAGGGAPGSEIVTIRRPVFLNDITAESVTISANSAL